jgi:hypothetical protein
MNRNQIFSVLFAILTCAVFSTMIEVQSRAIWIDPVTGSVKMQKHWLGFGCPPVIQVSSIERWVIDHEGVHRPRWKFLTRATFSITGKFLAVACSSAPEIYRLDDSELNSGYVRTASDTEIAEFVRIMRTGTASEQKQAVSVAISKAVGADSKARRAGRAPSQP